MFRKLKPAVAFAALALLLAVRGSDRQRTTEQRQTRNDHERVPSPHDTSPLLRPAALEVLSIAPSPDAGSKPIGPT
jgi:hypothetical protein